MTSMKLTCAVLAIALIAAFAFHDIESDDLWWHLKLGQIIYTTAQMPSSETFSHTVSGKSWEDEAWLTQLIFYLIFASSGPKWLIILQFFLLLATLAAIYATCARRSFAIFSAILPLVLIAASPRFMVRPDLFTFFFTSLFLFILESHIERPRRLIFALPFLQAVWTNMHGGFPLGPAIIFIYLLDGLLSYQKKSRQLAVSEESPRYPALPLLISGLASVAATFVNPYGPKFILSPIHLIMGRSITGHIAEFQPTLSSENFSFSLMAFLALVSIGATSFLLRIKKLRLRAILLYAMFLYFSLAGVRFVALFSFVVLPIIVVNIDEWWRTILGKNPGQSFIGLTKLAEKGLFSFLIAGQAVLDSIWRPMLITFARTDCGKQAWAYRK